MSQTTNILELQTILEEDDIQIDDENLSKYIVDLSLSAEKRLEALNKYYNKFPEDTLEVINKLSMMYELSGTKILRQYLFDICEKSSIDPLLQSIACKTLHLYDEKDDIGYEAVDIVYPKLKLQVGTPYRIDFVKILMKNEKYKDKAKEYFCEIINDNNIDCNYRYKTILSLEKEQNMVYFIETACFAFLQNNTNLIRLRILSSQYLLGKKFEQELVEKFLLHCAQDEKLDVNIRADATDVLLQLGSDTTKQTAKNIIMELGSNGKRTNTIYDNSQNVHHKKVEESLNEGLEFLQGFEIMKYRGKPITFEIVEKKILKLDKTKETELKVALNRIYMDRALYSAYNCTLSHILLKIWTYICDHEKEKELKIRLVQELCDMADTCSSGFATRLLNTISGFGDFSVRISWADQIAGNLSGRLNALIRDMDNLTLQEKILNEMTLPSSNYEERKNFLKFFRKNLPAIKEEIYQEFKAHLPDESFDLYFRSAISTYEGNLQ